MNLHPLINGTLGLWQFQHSLADSSGFASTLSTLDSTTARPHPAGGTEAYTTIDTCLAGFAFDGSTALYTPLVSFLWLTGDFTIEWIMKMTHTTTQACFSSCDPNGRSGGNGVDRIGSLFSLYCGSGAPAYVDQHIGSNLPTPGYGGFSSQGTAWGAGGAGNTYHHYAFRRAGTLVDVFVDGTKNASSVITVGSNTPTNQEHFYVGSSESSGEVMASGDVYATVRVVNYGRSDAAVAADAAFTMGVCGSTPTYPVIDSQTSTLAPGLGSSVVYDAVAMAQFARALHSSPRAP